MSSVARWLLFFPGALIAAFLVLSAVELFDRVYPWRESDWLSNVLLVAAGWVLVTFTFVAVGAKIAPAFRRTVALGLSAFAVSTVLLDVVARLNGFQSGTTSPLESNLSDAGTVIGLALALMFVLRESRPMRIHAIQRSSSEESADATPRVN